MVNQKRVKELFYYKCGSLYWKEARGYKTKAGDLAGYCHKGTGRAFIKIDGKRYRQHRVIYLYHNGVMPKMVDHKDGDKLNNHIENLRAYTSSKNKCNRRIQKNNTSGFKGVNWDKNKCKWVAQIRKDGVHYHLGLFSDIKSASFAVFEARTRLHGVFANNG